MLGVVGELDITRMGEVEVTMILLVLILICELRKVLIR